MTESKTCASCAHFEPNERSDGTQGGTCRRYPPTPMILQKNATVLGAGAVGMAGVSPPVDPDFSCGEHLPWPPLSR
ncbi:hypothetical protein LCGC14_0639730 [marine sediment metagenome]|uniref:Uncharacterized protein n=1 Tax=marine sediment metagenome TaxID=412755 RepID=A0A0F9U7T2_9ZZZZ